MAGPYGFAAHIECHVVLLDNKLHASRWTMSTLLYNVVHITNGTALAVCIVVQIRGEPP